MMNHYSGLKMNQKMTPTMNPVSALHVTAQVRAILTAQRVTPVRAKGKSNMRQHYKIEPKPMPKWLETIYDCALAVIIGLLLSGALFEGLLK